MLGSPASPLRLNIDGELLAPNREGELLAPKSEGVDAAPNALVPPNRPPPAKTSYN